MMALGCLGLLLGFILLSEQVQNHWAVYMLPVACACTLLCLYDGHRNKLCLRTIW